MFQRPTKPAFPARTILLIAALAIALVYLLWNAQQAPSAAQSDEKTEQDEAEKESAEKTDGGLWPAEWFYAVREYPHFSPDVDAYSLGLETARLQENAARSRGGWPGFTAPWTVQGPGNIGARINTIAVHPVNRDIMYIGYSGGGIWKTTDGAATWLPIFDKQNFLSVGDITLDPKNPEIVYAGTGDPNISAYPFIGDGIWKSINGGQTWQHLGLTEARIITKVIVDPSNSNIIYAATMGLPFERTPNRGLYKTTDGGRNWQKVLFVSEDAGVIDLVMSPENHNVLYAAVWDRIRNNKESLVSGNNARIWKTTDGGTTWKKMEGGLPQDAKSRIGLTIDPQNGQRVMASYAGADLTFNAIYETLDGGTTWKKNAAVGLDPYFQGGFAWYFGKIRINPYNAKDIWILGVNTFRSVDGGQSWAFAVGSNNDVHVDHHDITFTDPNAFLLATDGGLYQSTDDGQNWNKIEQIPTTQFYRVAYNPFKSDVYYGGAQDNGTVVGNSFGKNDWTPVFGGDGFQAVFHPTDPKIQYFEFQNGSIFCSVDAGQNFLNGTEGIDDADRKHWDMQYIMSHHNSDIMYTGTYRAYRSFGHPAVWQPISPDLTDGIVFAPRFHTISTLDESVFDPNLLYIGTTDGNVWRGNPGNQNWEKISITLPNRYVSAVKASLNEPDRVFAAHTGYRDNDSTPRLHRSDDRGATWKPIVGDLPNLAINDLQLIPGHQDSLIFAATDGGVYATLDGGKHWERLGFGIPVVPVYDLDLNPSQKTLIAGSHARSIFSFPLDSLRLGADVSVFDPNAIRIPGLMVRPTIASREIGIQVTNLNSSQTAEVVICDLQGKVVWSDTFRAFQRELQPVDISAFPAGIYVAFARVGSRNLGYRKFVVTGE